MANKSTSAKDVSGATTLFSGIPGVLDTTKTVHELSSGDNFVVTVMDSGTEMYHFDFGSLSSKQYLEKWLNVKESLVVALDITPTDEQVTKALMSSLKKSASRKKNIKKKRSNSKSTQVPTTTNTQPSNPTSRTPDKIPSPSLTSTINSSVTPSTQTVTFAPSLASSTVGPSVSTASPLVTPSLSGLPRKIPVPLVPASTTSSTSAYTVPVTFSVGGLSSDPSVRFDPASLMAAFQSWTSNNAAQQNVSPALDGEPALRVTPHNDNAPQQNVGDRSDPVNVSSESQENTNAASQNGAPEGHDVVGNEPESVVLPEIDLGQDDDFYNDDWWDDQPMMEETSDERSLKRKVADLEDELALAKTQLRSMGIEEAAEPSEISESRNPTPERKRQRLQLNQHLVTPSDPRRFFPRTRISPFRIPETPASVVETLGYDPMLRFAEVLATPQHQRKTRDVETLTKFLNEQRPFSVNEVTVPFQGSPSGNKNPPAYNEPYNHFRSSWRAWFRGFNNHVLVQNVHTDRIASYLVGSVTPETRKAVTFATNLNFEKMSVTEIATKFSEYCDSSKMIRARGSSWMEWRKTGSIHAFGELFTDLAQEQGWMDATLCDNFLKGLAHTNPKLAERLTDDWTDNKIIGESNPNSGNSAYPCFRELVNLAAMLLLRPKLKKEDEDQKARTESINAIVGHPSASRFGLGHPERAVQEAEEILRKAMANNKRRRDDESELGNRPRSRSSSREREMKCYFCQRTDHVARDCVYAEAAQRFVAENLLNKTTLNYESSPVDKLIDEVQKTLEPYFPFVFKETDDFPKTPENSPKIPKNSPTPEISFTANSSNKRKVQVSINALDTSARRPSKRRGRTAKCVSSVDARKLERKILASAGTPKPTFNLIDGEFFDSFSYIQTARAEVLKTSETFSEISEVDPEWLDTRLILMDTNFGGKITQLLVDTGAGPSVISRKFAEKLGVLGSLDPTYYEVAAANKQQVQICGQVSLDFEILHALGEKDPRYKWTSMLVEAMQGLNDLDTPSPKRRRLMKDALPQDGSELDAKMVSPHRFRTCFLVADELSVDAILGMGTMRTLGAWIDIKNELTLLGGKVFSFDERRTSLRLCNEVTIQPHRGKRVALNAIGLDNGVYLVKDSVPTPPVGLEKDRALIDVENGVGYITLHNHSEEPITFARNAEVVELDNEEFDVDKGTKIEIDPQQLGKGCNNREQRRLLSKLVRKYENIFKSKLDKDTYETKTTHVIKLRQGTRPVRRRVPHYHPEKQKAMEETVKDLLDRDMIMEGESEWRAPLLVIPKPAGGFRVVVDYRGLNENTIPDSYPLPLISEILGRLSKAKYFTKMDLTEGFWHIRLAAESRNYTGFAVRGGTYVWKRLPMGLKNSPATFQRVMDETFGEFRDFCQPYIDDIIIFSETFEEHLAHIEMVFKRLRERGLMVKLPKCEFCAKEIEFLGHLVSAEGIRMQKRKTEAIERMAPPRDDKEVKRFLGMAGYYRRFIRDFSQRTHNLGQIARGKAKFEWTDVHQKEFDDIKKALTEDPVMAYPDFDRKFTLTTDASVTGLGAVLSQMYSEGERVVAYASRRLTPAEANYGITQLEALGVVWATELFREPYLACRRFNLITDHKALEKLQNLPAEGNRLLQRWSLKLQEYDMDIKYKPGATLHNADCLSRARMLAFINALVLGLKSKTMADYQSEDPLWGSFVKKLKDKVSANLHVTMERKGESAEITVEDSSKNVSVFVNRYKRNWQRFFLDDDGVLFRETRHGEGSIVKLCLPRELAGEVLTKVHEEGHWGTSRTYEHLSKYFAWRNMYQDCKEFCRSCHTCQCANKGKKNVGRMSYLEVKDRGEVIGIDTFSGIPKSNTGSGNEKILVITDFLTRYTMLVPVPDTSAETVANVIWSRWIGVFGPPRRIISDRGGNDGEFGNKVCKALYKLVGTEKLSTVGYRPQAMGQVERFNRTMVAFLTKMLERQADWELKLPLLMLQYNGMKHPITGYSPSFLAFGRDVSSFIDLTTDEGQEYFDSEKWSKSEVPALIRAIKDAAAKTLVQQQKIAELFNVKHQNELLKVVTKGTKILVKVERKSDAWAGVHSKLLPLWKGPYEVANEVNKPSKLSYYEDGMLKEVHVDRTKLYHTRPEWMNKKFGLLWDNPEIFPVREDSTHLAMEGGDSEFVPITEAMEVENRSETELSENGPLVTERKSDSDELSEKIEPPIPVMDVGLGDATSHQSSTMGTNLQAYTNFSNLEKSSPSSTLPTSSMEKKILPTPNEKPMSESLGMDVERPIVFNSKAPLASADGNSSPKKMLTGHTNAPLPSVPQVRVGNKVGVLFHDGEDGPQKWFCGRVTKIQDDKAFVKFLHGAINTSKIQEASEDDDWYPINQEMRLCSSVPNHRCTKYGKVLALIPTLKTFTQVKIRSSGEEAFVLRAEGRLTILVDRRGYELGRFARDQFVLNAADLREECRRKMRNGKRIARRKEKLSRSSGDF